MRETETLFAALRQSSDEAVVDMLERLVRPGSCLEQDERA